MILLIHIFILLFCFLLSKRQERYKKWLIVVNTIVILEYIVWRITVIPGDQIISTILGIILFLAELLGICQFMCFQFMFYKKSGAKMHDEPSTELNECPSVDILICTYNEPPQLIEKTLIAALNLHYPADKFTVNVCDDGKRQEISELCAKYGANWITRAGNEGAKAGNINHALKQIQGELFVVLDADMIPKKQFLQKTVGYFEEDKVAFVQTPQVYYNQDMYQFNLAMKIPNEQDFFMRDVQEARYAINAVLHIGTNVVFRKKYIEEIGGYPTYSITEDMAVGLMLHAKGYKGIFVNKELVFGLSATTFADLLSQRDRWCRGNLQVMSNSKVLFKKGLTMAQKIAYIDGVLYWYSSIQKMIFLIAPIFYLTTGFVFLDSTIQDVMTFFIPFMLGQIMIFKSLSPTTRSIKWAHIYEVAMAPHLSFSIMKHWLRLKTKFNVTPKDVTNQHSYFQFKIAFPHILLLILTLVGWYNAYMHLQEETMYFGAYVVNILWSIYNFYAIMISIFVAYQKPLYRKVERINIQGEPPIIIKTKDHQIIDDCYQKDLSEIGLRFVSYGKHEFNIDDEVFVSMDNKTFLEAKVIRIFNGQVVLKFSRCGKKEMHHIMEVYTENLDPYYSIRKT